MLNKFSHVRDAQVIEEGEPRQCWKCRNIRSSGLLLQLREERISAVFLCPSHALQALNSNVVDLPSGADYIFSRKHHEMRLCFYAATRAIVDEEVNSAELYKIDEAYVIANIALGKHSESLNYELITALVHSTLQYEQVELIHEIGSKQLTLVPIHKLLDTVWQHFAN